MLMEEEEDEVAVDTVDTFSFLGWMSLVFGGCNRSMNKTKNNCKVIFTFFDEEGWSRRETGGMDISSTQLC